MRPDLQPVVMALAELDERELAALIEATNSVPQIAPGLLAWIEHAADWELNRRQGLEHRLLPPEAAIPPNVDAVITKFAIAKNYDDTVVAGQRALDRNCVAHKVKCRSDCKR